MSTIVVGVDGSAASLEALRFAIDEARIRGAAVKAVHAWHVPTFAYGVGMAPVLVDVSAYEDDARAGLAKSLETAGVDASGPAVTSVVREGLPGDVMCEEAAGADLLVVGSRGLGGFRGLLLGSVSQQCAHDSPCPVVIIPARTVAEDAKTS